MSSSQLASHLQFFKSRPNFVFFANAVKLQLDNNIPNHPSDFYLLETPNNSKYFYCIRHNLLPDNCRPILLLGLEGKEETLIHFEYVGKGMEEISKIEPKLKDVDLLLGFGNVSQPAKSFLIEKFGLEQVGYDPCYTFYVHSDNYQTFLDYEPNTPEPYKLGYTRVEDAEIVNSTWKFASADDILQQREKILRLPTACIFHDNKPIAFEMVGLHGQLNHQYTFPDYRNQGLGTIVEKTIVQRCIEFGIIPYKSVEVNNEDVVKRSHANEKWSVVLGENGKPAVFDYIVLRQNNNFK